MLIPVNLGLLFLSVHHFIYPSQTKQGKAVLNFYSNEFQYLAPCSTLSCLVLNILSIRCDNPGQTLASEHSILNSHKDKVYNALECRN